MGLVGVIEPGGETLGEIGLQRRKPACIKSLEAARHAGETVEQHAVPRQRHHEAAIGCGAGVGLPPEIYAP